MIWITLISVLSFIVSLVLLKGIAVLASKVRPVEWDGSILDLLMDFPKTVIGFILVCMLYGLSLASYQMGQMYDCSVRSSVQKVQTQYSWYFDVCQFKNKDGAWIDFKQVRGNPDGDI